MLVKTEIVKRITITPREATILSDCFLWNSKKTKLNEHIGELWVSVGSVSRDMKSTDLFTIGLFKPVYEMVGELLGEYSVNCHHPLLGYNTLLQDFNQGNVK